MLAILKQMGLYLAIILGFWVVGYLAKKVLDVVWHVMRVWLRRNRAHRMGWASAKELREWELQQAKDTEYLRQIKGG